MVGFVGSFSVASRRTDVLSSSSFVQTRAVGGNVRERRLSSSIVMTATQNNVRPSISRENKPVHAKATKHGESTYVPSSHSLFLLIS